MADQGPLGKVVLLTSLAAGAIAIYQWLKNSECNTPGSSMYGGQVCGFLGMNPVAATQPTQIPGQGGGVTPITPPVVPVTPPSGPAMPTASQLTTWMQNAIQSPTANMDQWNYAMSALINGTSASGNPNPGPFVGPDPRGPYFTSNPPLSVLTAAQYLAAIQSYKAAGNTITGLSGQYSVFAPFFIPAIAIHSPGVY